ncbi:ankyrin repeat domain-containing protein [uncultured Tenacibaculum sp.]|uniref:ankyrin repeat domain-containing protein n=1 Tax=uncultured Tenacibaculum sp. TaxID=174713 RepID=UPI00261F20D4|nr:ankyrin repeat domain-containing protein [uncultured Tenacibaculum sp.]
MNFKSFILCVFVVGMLQAQKSKNIFLDRAFWKSKPTLELVKTKISEGNDPTALSGSSFDAISYALLETSDVVSNDIIKYLLTIKGNGVNKLTHDGRTYVFWAAYKDRLDLVKYLVAKGAKLDVIDSHGYTALNFAVSTGVKNIALFDYLVSKGVDVKKDKDLHGANALLLAIPTQKDFKLIDYFVSKGLSLNATDNDGNGAINYAAKKGNQKIIDQLIAKGLPYKNKNKIGGNAMIMATQGGRRGYNSLAFFKYLENKGVAPNVTTTKGLTPLHNLAYRNQDVASLQYFIDKGVSLDQQNEEGNTPLMNASYRNSLEVVQLLAEKTKNINVQNKKGQSALTNSLRNKTTVVNYLLEQNANVFVEDAKGNNLAFYLAASYNAKKEDEFVSKINLLKAKGFDFTKPQKDGNTLFHLAADKGNLPLLKFLQKFKIDVNAKNKEGQTALQKAVMVAKKPEIVKFLLVNGADKTVTTSFDETIYDLAQENEQLSKFDLSFLK